MIRVVVKKNGFKATDNDVESAMRTFKRKVNRDGILLECRKREYYVKPGVKKRLKHENALKEKRKLQKKRESYVKNY